MASVSSVTELIDQYGVQERGFSRSSLEGANLVGVHLDHIDLSQSNLASAEMDEADLSWAILKETNLSRASMIGINLHQADLSETNLSQANLCDSNLAQSKLVRANLSQVNLYEADLIEADLTEANLSGANLMGADLTDAILTNTILAQARFNSVTRFPEGFDPVAMGMERTEEILTGFPKVRAIVERALEDGVLTQEEIEEIGKAMAADGRLSLPEIQLLVAISKKVQMGQIKRERSAS